mmetsp:Transcript_23342/g.79064  ORF Transcript_23342/g.79064 Transcript_23342/m.79064 type:complete len:205 (+) Transcript_23342:214-828(+)
MASQRRARRRFSDGRVPISGPGAASIFRPDAPNSLPPEEPVRQPDHSPMRASPPSRTTCAASRSYPLEAASPSLDADREPEVGSAWFQVAARLRGTCSAEAGLAPAASRICSALGLPPAAGEPSRFLSGGALHIVGGREGPRSPAWRPRATRAGVEADLVFVPSNIRFLPVVDSVIHTFWAIQEPSVSTRSASRGKGSWTLPCS